MTDSDRWQIDLLVNGAIGLATVAALIVALIQVRHARSEAIAARDAIARERRLSFELQLLADIYHQWGITGTQHLSGYVRALIVDPRGDQDIPLLRAVTGQKPPPSSGALLARYPRRDEAFEHAIIQELDDAIDRRLKEAG